MPGLWDSRPGADYLVDWKLSWTCLRTLLNKCGFCLQVFCFVLYFSLRILNTLNYGVFNPFLPIFNLSGSF